MKKIFLLALLMHFVSPTNAQIGVLTLKKRDDVYYGQWFTLKKNENQLFLVDNEKNADAALQRLLAPYEIAYEDAEIDEDGDLFWVVESNNGFTSKVYRISGEDNQIILIVSTMKITDNGEFNAWHQKITNRVGYLF